MIPSVGCHVKKLWKSRIRKRKLLNFCGTLKTAHSCHCGMWHPGEPIWEVRWLRFSCDHVAEPCFQWRGGGGAKTGSAPVFAVSSA